MIYRNMQISDYESVIALWRDCQGVSLRDADSAEGVGKYLQRNPALSFVAADETSIVGTIMAGHDGKRGYIQHLAVANAARGQGIATSLVEHCLEALNRQGIEKSHVHVLGNNEPGRKFWSGLGWFHRSEIVMYSFINGENTNA